jgi:hypothetical protein
MDCKEPCQRVNTPYYDLREMLSGSLTSRYHLEG